MNLDSTFSQLLAGAYEVWFAVAYVAAMFVCTAFRGQNIRNKMLWKNSLYCFAAYMLIPTIVNVVISVFLQEPGRPNFGGNNLDPLRSVTQLLSIVYRLLLTTSILTGVLAFWRINAGRE